MIPAAGHLQLARCGQMPDGQLSRPTGQFCQQTMQVVRSWLSKCFLWQRLHDRVKAGMLCWFDSEHVSCARC